MKLKQIKRIEPKQIKSALDALFPESSKKTNVLQSENLFSPFQIELPKVFLENIQTFNLQLNTLYKLNLNLLLNNKLKPKGELIVNNTFTPKPLVLSCLDFHLNLETNELKLIEANTNASGYLITSLAYYLHNLNFNPWFNKLNFMFKESGLLQAEQFFITDENPVEQKMFLEFLMYQEHFKKQNINFEIIDTGMLNKLILELVQKNPSITIYNRNTDFYLNEYKNLKAFYFDNKINLNPHPIGYDLWAQKENLEEWLKSDLLNTNEDLNPEVFKKHLLKSAPINTLFKDIDEAWLNRKNYFLKPQDSYGGKATYRGASISRKYFQNVWDQNFIAQEYFPAPKFFDESENEWKFDLRVFVYENEVLLPLARVYQGQITNFNTPGGGFAPVTFY